MLLNFGDVVLREACNANHAGHSGDHAGEIRHVTNVLWKGPSAVSGRTSILGSSSVAKCRQSVIVREVVRG